MRFPSLCVPATERFVGSPSVGIPFTLSIRERGSGDTRGSQRFPADRPGEGRTNGPGIEAARGNQVDAPEGVGADEETRTPAQPARSYADCAADDRHTALASEIVGIGLAHVCGRSGGRCGRTRGLASPATVDRGRRVSLCAPPDGVQENCADPAKRTKHTARREGHEELPIAR